MEKTLTIFNFYNHPRFWRHAIPWLAMLAFMYLSIYIIGKSEDGEPIETSNTVFLVLAVVFFLIYGSFYAYNRFYKREKKKVLSILIIIAIIIIASAADHYYNTQAVQLGAIEGFWANIIIFPVIVLVSFGLKMAYHGSHQVFAIERLQAKQTESELKLLKSQVNPHFLFNTLNNIYSTNLEDHEKANEIILELSDLLRYQLESSKKTFTPLTTEVTNIENYIHLEKIRVRDCIVEVTKEGDFKTAEIVPLLLLPFVENAFKYGTGIEQGHIRTDIKLNSENEFHFNITNKIVQKKGKVHSGGIGLKNVQKRLALMYPSTHKLDIQTIENKFIVDLKIQL